MRMEYDVKNISRCYSTITTNALRALFIYTIVSIDYYNTANINILAIVSQSRTVFSGATSNNNIRNVWFVNHRERKHFQRV